MAYSQTDISTNHVYIEIPKGFEFGGSRDTCWVHILKNLYGKNDDNEDTCNLEENSGVPSLCNMGYMAMATELISFLATKVAHILVQSRLHNDKLQPFKTKDPQEGSKMCPFQALFGVGIISFHSALLTATTSTINHHPSFWSLSFMPTTVFQRNSGTGANQHRPAEGLGESKYCCTQIHCS
jgi:hypothetical protein